MLPSLLGRAVAALTLSLAKGLTEWLLDKRRERDLRHLAWQEADLQHLREVNNALKRMAAVHYRPARDRLRERTF